MEKLEKNLRKLKANREKVERNVLKTRYKASYEALLKEIEAEATTLARYVLFGSLPIRAQDDGTEAFEAFIAQSNLIIQEEREAFRIYSRKISEDYDVDGAVAELERVARRIENEAYVHYQAAHCRRIDDRIWNDLAKMWWNPELRLWEHKNGQWVRFRCLPPPPEGI